MRIRLILAALLLLLSLPGAALASLRSEVRQGGALVEQIRAGSRTCAALSAEDFDHIGEYAMSRALASGSLHQTMNDRMELMLGSRGESRMHEVLGERYAGCAAAQLPSGYGMMGGAGAGAWTAMMGAAGWGWMMSGSWRDMTRQDWRVLERRMLGIDRADAAGGWSPIAIVGATLAGVVLLGGAILLVIRNRFRRPPVGASPV